jgi:hypothetical protein
VLQVRIKIRTREEYLNRRMVAHGKRFDIDLSSVEKMREFVTDFYDPCLAYAIFVVIRVRVV